MLIANTPFQWDAALLPRFSTGQSSPEARPGLRRSGDLAVAQAEQRAFHRFGGFQLLGQNFLIGLHDDFLSRLNADDFRTLNLHDPGFPHNGFFAMQRSFSY
ncbi:MAG: hypothetical protein QNJ09_02390 [Paracoccaceae bacterium]|nr:hypothetical protein [Paracoccaceae bacterium]